MAKEFSVWLEQYTENSFDMGEFKGPVEVDKSARGRQIKNYDNEKAEGTRSDGKRKFDEGVKFAVRLGIPFVAVNKDVATQAVSERGPLEEGRHPILEMAVARALRGQQD